MKLKTEAMFAYEDLNALKFKNSTAQKQIAFFNHKETQEEYNKEKREKRQNERLRSLIDTAMCGFPDLIDRSHLLALAIQSVHLMKKGSQFQALIGALIYKEVKK